ncbi:MAG: STAS domain-containing protein [Planctomycetota bacterium]|jgi:anti-anti-sigma factor
MRIERRTSGDVTVLSCAGAIDADGVRRLRKQTGAAVETGCQQVVVSLGDVAFSDSQALAHLVTASQRPGDGGGEVVFSASSGNRQMLKTLGLSGQLKVFPDDQAALAHFGEDGAALGLKLQRPLGWGRAGPEEGARPRP